MGNLAAYPNNDIRRAASGDAAPTMARIVHVEPDSPAYDAGFEPGCFLTSVDGEPLRDIIDWRWLSGEECITVGYVDLDGEAGEVELWRDPGEDWGFEFEGLVFDNVKQCRNRCTFCFMYQLPRGMRRSLYLRDDDFRLSFLVGTFVTLTNITPADEARIVEQCISPLRVSLQVTNRAVRDRMIGKNAQHGLEVLDRLLSAGIEFHAQVVLVPGENDGAVLQETLEWAYARPGILNVGIVPLGYTRHQTRFDHSFNGEEDSQSLLATVEPFQRRALAERGTAWVFAADEFYRNAYGKELLGHLPPTAHYGDFELFEDGIGIIRSTVDDWETAEREGAIARCAEAARAASARVRMVAGFAQKEFLDALVAKSGIGDWFAPLYVKNDYFGGNVDVTGLLTAQDIVAAVRATREGAAGSGTPCALVLARTGDVACDSSLLRNRATREGAAGSGTPCALVLARTGDVACDSSLLRNRAQGVPDPAARPAGEDVFVVPSVIFNDDELTLDDQTLADMEKAAGHRVSMVSCSPLDYFHEITELLRASR